MKIQFNWCLAFAAILVVLMPTTLLAQAGMDQSLREIARDTLMFPLSQGSESMSLEGVKITGKADISASRGQDELLRKIRGLEKWSLPAFMGYQETLMVLVVVPEQGYFVFGAKEGVALKKIKVRPLDLRTIEESTDWWQNEGKGISRAETMLTYHRAYREAVRGGLEASGIESFSFIYPGKTNRVRKRYVGLPRATALPFAFILVGTNYQPKLGGIPGSPVSAVVEVLLEVDPLVIDALYGDAEWRPYFFPQDDPDRVVDMTQQYEVGEDGEALVVFDGEKVTMSEAAKALGGTAVTDDASGVVTVRTERPTMEGNIVAFDTSGSIDNLPKWLAQTDAQIATTQPSFLVIAVEPEGSVVSVGVGGPVGVTVELADFDVKELHELEESLRLVLPETDPTFPLIQGLLEAEEDGWREGRVVKRVSVMLQGGKEYAVTMTHQTPLAVACAVVDDGLICRPAQLSFREAKIGNNWSEYLSDRFANQSPTG